MYFHVMNIYNLKRNRSRTIAGPLTYLHLKGLFFIISIFCYKCWRYIQIDITYPATRCNHVAFSNGNVLRQYGDSVCFSCSSISPVSKIYSWKSDYLVTLHSQETKTPPIPVQTTVTFLSHKEGPPYRGSWLKLSENTPTTPPALSLS